jgi:glyoxalase family protein
MNTEIHHIAAISSDMQRTIRFYSHILGLQVRHKHAEFEGPKVCHFHWNEELQSYLTFFHCPQLRGDRQSDSPYAVSFAVDLSSFEYWVGRFKNTRIPFSQSTEVFDERPVLELNDPDGLPLKLVFTTADKRKGLEHPSIPLNFAIKGIYGVEIPIKDQHDLTTLFNTGFGWTMQQKGTSTRYSGTEELNGVIDMVKSQDCFKSTLEGRLIHHIAFAIKELESYTKVLSYIHDTNSWSFSRWREHDILSLYFQIPEGILFEILVSPSVFVKRNLFPQLFPSVVKKKAEGATVFS